MFIITKLAILKQIGPIYSGLENEPRAHKAF